MLSPVSAYRSQTTVQDFPLVTGLSSRTSVTSEDTSYCSAPSTVLRRCQTAQWRACKDYGHGPSLTVLLSVSAGDTELSRFSNIECPHMRRFFDSVRSNSGWLVLSLLVLPSPWMDKVGTPNVVISEFNSWPVLPPVNASREASRPPAHDSGP
jgi:hypothetical protein